MEKILGVFFPFTTTTSTIATHPLLTHPTPPPIIQTLTLNIHTYLSFPLLFVFTLLPASISLYLLSTHCLLILFLHSYFFFLNIALCFSIWLLPGSFEGDNVARKWISHLPVL